jgi:ATP synthase protein I
LTEYAIAGLDQLTQATQARRVLVTQAILAPIAGVSTLAFGILPALSALIGGAVCLVANGAVVLWVFRDYRAQAPEALVLRLFGAEAIKVALVLGLFAAALVLVEALSLPFLLGGYFAVQVLSPILAVQKA